MSFKCVNNGTGTYIRILMTVGYSRVKCVSLNFLTAKSHSPFKVHAISLCINIFQGGMWHEFSLFSLFNLLCLFWGCHATEVSPRLEICICTLVMCDCLAYFVYRHQLPHAAACVLLQVQWDKANYLVHRLCRVGVSNTLLNNCIKGKCVNYIINTLS